MPGRPTVLHDLGRRRERNAVSVSDFYPEDTDADPVEIRCSAEGLRAISGDLLGHGDNVGFVLGQVALSFSEVVSTAVAAQIGANAALLEAAVESTEYGYGVGSAWADDVEAFLVARHDLVVRWEATEQTDFGVPPPAGLTNAEPEMAERLYDQRRQAISAARQAELQLYIAEGSRLWERFQTQVTEKARMFREGPTAPNLALLKDYLGWGGTTLWPGIATTPVRGAADGSAAGETVVDGLDGRACAEDVAGALSTIAMITRRAAEGQQLSGAELAYLEAFYTTVGVRILDVPAYLGSSSGPMFTDPHAPPRYVPTIPFNGSPELVEALAMAAANGLLVLSRPTSRTDDDSRDGYERLPTWLRDTLAIEDNDPYSNPHDHFQRMADLGDLLGYSTVEAGPGLSREIAESVDWMIDYAESREDSSSAQAQDSLRAQIASSAPHLLDVVARNDEVCFDLLTGSGMPDGFSPTDYFTNIYSFDWAVDDGAAAASLTDFIPAWASGADPLDQRRAEDAMFDLVQIVTDGEGFDLLMDGVGTSGVAAQSALGQVNPAITDGLVVAMAPFMDQFAAPQREDADASGLGGLSLETRVRFTTLIGTDPGSAAALAGLAHAYEQQELFEYAGSGNAEENGGNVGRIRGIVEAGLVNAGIDAGADQADAEIAAARTRQMGSDIAQALLGGIPVPGVSGLVDTVFAVINAESVEPAPAQSATPSPDRTEAQRRYDTAAGVMTAMVATGQISPSALPAPYVGPSVEEPPSTEEATQALLDAAAAAGYDLNLILNRIESAYSDPDLVDERGN
ncbi:MAG: hypothetical protein M3313_11415 [Actinomycetota bacterium]|nr:hypothetical protein [Actinomycetota bacterium]